MEEVLVVPEESNGERVDKFLSTAVKVPRAKLKQLFDEKKVKINGKVVAKQGTKVKKGDKVELIGAPKPKNEGSVPQDTKEEVATKKEDVLERIARMRKIDPTHDLFSYLNRDAILHILKFLDVKALCAVAEVSREFAALSCSNSLWKGACAKLFGFSDYLLDKKRLYTKQPTFKDFYKEYARSCVIFGTSKGLLPIVDLKSGNLQRALKCKKSVASAIQMVDDLVIAGCADGTLRVFDFFTGRLLSTIGYVKGENRPRRPLPVVQCLRVKKVDKPLHLVAEEGSSSSSSSANRGIVSPFVDLIGITTGIHFWDLVTGQRQRRRLEGVTDEWSCSFDVAGDAVVCADPQNRIYMYKIDPWATPRRVLTAIDNEEDLEKEDEEVVKPIRIIEAATNLIASHQFLKGTELLLVRLWPPSDTVVLYDISDEDLYPLQPYSSGGAPSYPPQMKPDIDPLTVVCKDALLNPAVEQRSRAAVAVGKATRVVFWNLCGKKLKRGCSVQIYDEEDGRNRSLYGSRVEYVGNLVVIEGHGTLLVIDAVNGKVLIEREVDPGQVMVGLVVWRS